MNLLPFYDPQAEGGGGDAPKLSFSANWVPMESVEGQVQQMTVAQPAAGQPAEGSAATPAASATETSTASDGGQTQTASADQPAAAQPEPVAEPAAKSWEEAIKEVDKSKVLSILGSKKEIMKALGISDFVADLNDYYDTTGNVDEYLNARAVDYTKMSDEAIFRIKVERDHKNASPEIRDMILAEELAKFRVSDEEGQNPDPKKVAYANYQKEQAAKAIRETLIAEQQKFTIPTKEVTANNPEVREAIIKEIEAENRAKHEQITKEYTARNNADPRTQKLVTSKTLPIYDGVNFGVENVDDILKYTTGEKSFWDLVRDKDGNPNLDLWYEAVAFLMNPKGYKDQIFNAGKTSAHKAEIDDGGDAGHTQVTTGDVSAPRYTPWQEIERRGVPS